jgi:phosphate transport system substrate-binding protein
MTPSLRPRPLSHPQQKESTVRRHITLTTALVASLASLLVVLLATPSLAVSHDTIEGSGSSWSALAVQQWIADVKSGGLQVVYTAPGSAQGRKDFANVTTDYAVSDIGFRGVDPSGALDTNQGRAYAYLPIVAGGTSFPYNLTVGGKRVTNLRLSGLTLAKIFTNQITTWADDAITADNNGRRLPAIAIVPLVHSEGSGSTAQLTTYFDTVFPSIWSTYQGKAGFTEYYPINKRANAGMLAQNGSDQVINYATSSAANGVITYDEYSYALAKNLPVAKVQNAAGYFTLPTQYNVAVALTRAQINTNKNSPDYLLQNLTQVYANPDKRTYPLSSYSYMIIPTGATDRRMNTAKRQTLVDYLYYSVCTGQKEMGPIGYSPLPINLVQASFDQTNKLKDADPAVDITRRDVSTCHNPTFVAGNPSRNFLAEIAPQPQACDRSGTGPCTGNAVKAILGNPTGGKAPSGPAGSAAGAGSGAGSGAGGSAAGAGSSAPKSAAPGSPGSKTPTAGAPPPTAAGATGGPTAIDPVTGQVVALGGAAPGVDGSQVAVPTDVAANSAVSSSLLYVLTIAILLLAIAMPPLIGLTVSRRARGRR